MSSIMLFYVSIRYIYCATIGAYEIHIFRFSQHVKHRVGATRSRMEQVSNQLTDISLMPAALRNMMSSNILVHNARLFLGGVLCEFNFSATIVTFRRMIVRTISMGGGSLYHNTAVRHHARPSNAIRLPSPHD
jgi:hypothetical protein